MAVIWTTILTGALDRKSNAAVSFDVLMKISLSLSGVARVANQLDYLLQRSNRRAAAFTSFDSFNQNAIVGSKHAERGPVSRPACHKRPIAKGLDA